MFYPKEKLLLSTAYFPPVEYMAHISVHKETLVERFENYSKQSYRNRCNILSANGKLPLIIPVKRFRGKKTPIKEVKPDYSYSWQRLHLISINSAYRSAPFFEYYFDDFRVFFERKYDYLIDLNAVILDRLLTVIKLDVNWRFTSSFMATPPPDVNDMRETIHPKPSKSQSGREFKINEYCQVFDNRHGFQPNLSIIDLLFNLGPDAGSYLKESVRMMKPE